MKAAKIVILSFIIMMLTMPAMANKIDGIGVVFEVYDLGTYSSSIPWHQDFSGTTKKANNNWFYPAHNFKNPVYLYHLNPNLVRNQMLNMKASGVDVLVLHIRMADLATCEVSGACPNPFFDGIWGYLTDVSQSALRPQQRLNLQNIVQYASEIGFRQVFLRFGALPSATNVWDEVAYQKIWNFIVDTRQVASTILNGTATRLMTDLGGENMGLLCNGGAQCPGLQAYVSRLWSDYTYSFGVADTVGFSFIGCSWIVQNGLPWYGSVKPNQYAFTIYGGCNPGGNVKDDLIASWEALGTEKSKPIMIIETYHNDQVTAANLAAALAEKPAMQLTDIVQWPTTRVPPCSGCDANIQDAAVAAQNTTTQISNYLPIANNVSVDNLNPTLLKFDASACTAASPTTCGTVDVGYAPAGANTGWYITVTGNNGARSGWGCNAGTSTSATPGWMARGVSYRFDYYKVSTCASLPVAGTESATSYIYFR